MKTIQWKGREWRNGQIWGDHNPKDLREYWDISQIKINQNGDLYLSNEYKPKQFANSPGKHRFSVGLLTCEDDFFYGDYLIKAKLPDGVNDWPAIWLWGKSWPPEIDILEAYSNDKGSYFRWGWPLWASESNFHYREDGVNKTTGTKRINTCFKNPKKFTNYAMRWRYDYIKLYADGILVRTLKGGLMQYFREPMRFVLNNSVRPQKKPTDKCGAMVVRSFDYTPYHFP